MAARGQCYLPSAAAVQSRSWSQHQLLCCLLLSNTHSADIASCCCLCWQSDNPQWPTKWLFIWWLDSVKSEKRHSKYYHLRSDTDSRRLRGVEWCFSLVLGGARRRIVRLIRVEGTESVLHSTPSENHSVISVLHSTSSDLWSELPCMRDLTTMVLLTLVSFNICDTVGWWTSQKGLRIWVKSELNELWTPAKQALCILCAADRSSCSWTSLFWS